MAKREVNLIEESEDSQVTTSSGVPIATDIIMIKDGVNLDDLVTLGDFQVRDGINVPSGTEFGAISVKNSFGTVLGAGNDIIYQQVRSLINGSAYLRGYDILNERWGEYVKDHTSIKNYISKYETTGQGVFFITNFASSYGEGLYKVKLKQLVGSVYSECELDITSDIIYSSGKSVSKVSLIERLDPNSNVYYFTTVKYNGLPLDVLEVTTSKLSDGIAESSDISMSIKQVFKYE